MKKLLKIVALALVLLVGISLVVSCGDSTESSGNTKTETKDPVAAAKAKLSEAYTTCCKGADKRYASRSSDGMSLTIDTKPDNKSYSGEADACDAIVAINKYLGLPSSLNDKMESTRALDGMQTQDCGSYTVTWNYHPDNGLKVIYEVKAN